MSIDSLLGKECLMGSVLCDLTVFQYTDAVCIAYGGQSVCDHDYCFSLRKSGKSLLHFCFIIWVCKGSCLIKDQNRSVLEHGSCNGKPLCFTAAFKIAAVIRHEPEDSR